MCSLKIGIITLLLITLAHLVQAQPYYIVKIGNEEISKDEFRNRYELSPRILNDVSDSEDSTKLKFLYSLIAEKLFSIEARRIGLTSSTNYKFYYLPIKKSIIRDQVFQNEIADKVNITDYDIENGMNKYIKILKLKTLASSDSTLMANLYSKLKNLGSIDSLILIEPDDSFQVAVSEIKFGVLNDEKIEDQLYNLKLNKFTEPIKNENNWFIFELDNIKTNIPQYSNDKLINEVKKIIRNRRTRYFYNKFYEKYFGGIKIKADEDTFIKISQAFFNVINSKKESPENNNTTNEYYLTENDIINVRENLGSEFLKTNLFKTKYGDATVYDFLSDLTIVDVKFESTDPDRINKVLSNELKRFMQQETVYQIGVALGIEYSGEVKSQLRLWNDNILAQLYRNQFNSSIKTSKFEIEQFYNNNLPDSLKFNDLNIQTITVSDLDHIKMIYDLINKGENFDSTISKLGKEQNVMLDTITSYNELKIFKTSAEEISELKPGEIYGPVKTNEGFTLVKMINNMNLNDSVKEKIDLIKENIKRKLFNKKLNKLLEDKAIELANKYQITINKDYLYSEKYSNINLFVHKYLGFGGRIAAVPYTTPFFNWYYKWKNNPGLNP